MDVEHSFKEGYLLFQTQGMLVHLKKTWQRKYVQLFKASKQGIERLEMFESEEESHKNSAGRIITLECCVKITQDAQKNQQYVFSIYMKGGSVYLFACLTEEEMTEWLSALQTVAFKDNFSRQTIEEDNDLYCSSGEGLFSVKLIESEASKRCGLEPGQYTLVVAPTALQLRDAETNDLLLTWPYRYIRRYGHRTGRITFEAGRKCDSGEGEFLLEHSNQELIFRCMLLKMQSMKQMLNGDSSRSALCTETQFRAAMSMLPRSRSPLVPSPTSATVHCEHDFSFSSSSQASLPRMVTPTPSLQVPSLIPKPIPCLGVIPTPTAVLSKGTKPAKPPRRDLEQNRNQTFSVSPPPPVLDYDHIEYRQDAWRTFGLDEAEHTEVPNNADDYEDIDAPRDDCLNPQGQNQVSPQAPLTVATAPKIFTAQRVAPDTYDKLEHFGSTSTLRRPGYTQLHSMTHSYSLSRLEPLSHSRSRGCSQEELDADPMESCRKADDSHYGYGSIRKPLPASNVSSPILNGPILNGPILNGPILNGPILNGPILNGPILNGPNHELCNEQEYALICKAKWV